MIGGETAFHLREVFAFSKEAIDNIGEREHPIFWSNSNRFAISINKADGLRGSDPDNSGKAEIESQLLAYCALDTYAMVRLWSTFTGTAVI